jgi:hypothetical protein
VNFLFICSNIPAAPAYGVYISQLMRYSRACGPYHDFLDRGLLLKPSSIHIALLKQVTSRGAGTTHSSGAHVFYTVLCRLLFVFLPILSWLLYSLAFDLRVLITLEIYLKVDICSIFLFFLFLRFSFLFFSLFIYFVLDNILTSKNIPFGGRSRNKITNPLRYTNI